VALFCLNYGLAGAAVELSMAACPSIPTTIMLLLLDKVSIPNGGVGEIRRKSEPLGVKMIGDGYQSDSAAQFAGKKALADFLSGLAKEDKRLPKK
jgi:hypothetical protein